MDELQESIIDDSWKQSLRSAIIIALTESGQTKNQALEQVGSLLPILRSSIFLQILYGSITQSRFRNVKQDVVFSSLQF